MNGNPLYTETPANNIFGSSKDTGCRGKGRSNKFNPNSNTSNNKGQGGKKGGGGRSVGGRGRGKGVDAVETGEEWVDEGQVQDVQPNVEEEWQWGGQLDPTPNIGVEWQETKPIRVVGAVDGRCWDRLSRSSGILYPAWVLSAVRRGKQRQFVCWIRVTTAYGKVKLAKCLIDNASEVNLVRKGFLQEDDAKVSSTPVQLEGVSGHRLDGGDREADLAVRLVKQSVCSVETVTEEWFSRTFYEATIRYDFFLGQPWLQAHRVSPMGHRTCFIQDPSASDPSELYYLHPYTKSVQHFKERNKLRIQQVGQEWTRNQEPFAEGKVESLNCKKWESVCYRVVDKWRDILVDYFEQIVFAKERIKRFSKFYDDAWSGDWSEPLWINPPFDVFPRVVQKLKQSGAKAILTVPNWPKQIWFEDVMDISIDIVELTHKGVKLYCEDNGKPLPQRSWSTLPCLVDRNLGDYWQDASEMGTDEVISNSSRIDEIEVNRDNRERNLDTSSRKEGRTIGVPQENASIDSNSSSSDKNKAKNVKISSKKDDKPPRISPELTSMQLDSSDHPFQTFVDPLHWWDSTGERAKVSFIRQQCDKEVWNDVAKNMRPQPTICKLVDIMSVMKCRNQVEGDTICARRDAVFEDYKDDVLSGKLWKNPPI